MNLLIIVIACAAILMVAYRVYGSLLVKLLQLDDTKATPANTLRDDVDYVPTEPKFLLSQHFSAIAAAGPIVGPILAGVAFGWAPALIWIMVGCIFIGGVHDITALIASVRHKARSIAEVVRQHMTQRSYLLFLGFIYIALIYIIVAFTDVVASSFVGEQLLDDGSKVTGGGTASSSLIYLVLPIVMGLLLRFTKLSLNLATLIFLPMVGLAIWAGPMIPFDLAAMMGKPDTAAIDAAFTQASSLAKAAAEAKGTVMTDAQLATLRTTVATSLQNAPAIKLWDVLLLGYCLIAAVVPVWMLLQPRGHLGGYFLYIAMAAAVMGIVIGGVKAWVTGDATPATIAYPAFTGFTSTAGETLFPILFITIACGACSGFHCLIASGTTSKQLRRETDAKTIGYGAMLMEGFVAVVSLGCVMMLASGSAVVKQGPNAIYANGIGSFLNQFGIPIALGYGFGLLAFTTFVYDTLDVCTRLGRYIIQELTGLKGKAGAWIGTTITAAVPLIFVMLPAPIGANGKPVPAWRTFWGLFGASNQLLAALALIGVTVWLWKTYKKKWVWYVTGLPAIWMYAMSVWALSLFIKGAFFVEKPTTPLVVAWVSVVLIVLAVLLLVEALRVFAGKSQPPATPSGEVVPA